MTKPRDADSFQPVEELGLMTNLSVRLKKVIRPMPTAPAYDLDAITSRREPPAAKAAAAPGKRLVKLLPGRRERVDDPFLQRLARLN